jgi:hypothetical protein
VFIEAIGAIGDIGSHIAREVFLGGLEEDSEALEANVYGTDEDAGEAVDDVMLHIEEHNTRSKIKRKVEQSSVSQHSQKRRRATRNRGELPRN